MLNRFSHLGFVFFEDVHVDIRGDFSIAMTEVFQNTKSSASAGLFVIFEHLGHCNTEITSNIYVHIFKEYKAKMAESIEHDLL